MEILSKEEVQKRKDEILQWIKNNKVFIYPTDTIYGIGCNATEFTAVKKIREIKKRITTPFSVIAPSKEWIKNNCLIADEKWLDKLPGPYTLILPLKNIHAVAPNVSNGKTLGVRIPDHWFSSIIRELSFPIVTTSANIHGEPFMTSLETLSPEIQSQIDFIIYEGEKKGTPSTLIDLSQNDVKEIKR